MLTNQNTFLYIRSNVLNYRLGPFFSSMESGIIPEDPYIIRIVLIMYKLKYVDSFDIKEETDRKI